MPEGWQPRGATPCPRSGEVAERSYPCPRPGVVAQRSYPMPEARGSGPEELPDVQGAVAAWVQEGLEELLKVRRGGCEETPLVQGKEQQLQFAGAPVKRYPTFKVRETQVRW